MPLLPIVLALAAPARAEARVATGCRATGTSTLAAVTCARLPVVSSLDRAYTRRFFRRLERTGRVTQMSTSTSATATCRPLEAVFYAATDWVRLAQKLAADASPCAQYYISIPAVVGDKSQPRPGRAAEIRALGPQFHAMAEIHWTGWSKWVDANGATWYDAGLEARRRMVAAGYDVTQGDLWAVNEFPSGVRRNGGTARANARDFVRGLYEGGDALDVPGLVFVIGIGQQLLDTSVYKATLEGWLEDTAFWADMQSYVRFWAQEVYANPPNWGVAGSTAATRRDYLNDFLWHKPIHTRVEPGEAATARTFLEAAYSPLANAAWQWDFGFGQTTISSLRMQSFVSTETYALRSFPQGPDNRFGFAWAPRNATGMTTEEFQAETAEILSRLAQAIRDSGEEGSEPGIGACTPPSGELWCGSEIEGAWFNEAWKAFAFWGDYTLAALPSSASTVAGETTAYTISVGSERGFSGDVELSVGGLPAAATASLAPTLVTAPGSSTLTVTTSPETLPGTYTVTVTGLEAPTARTASIELVVNAPPPPPTTAPSSPAPPPPPSSPFIGTGRADVLLGTGADEVFRGLGGNDTIRARGGDDDLYGNAGKDRLEAGGGNDRLFGGTGADRLFGGSGADRLNGGAGPDRLSGGSGADRLVGGPGADRFFTRDGRRDVVACGPGRDRVVADRLDRLRGCERVSRR